MDQEVGGAATAPEDFDAACSRVLDYLTDAVPMGAWAVTRVVGETQLFLDGRDARYGFMTAGAEFPWRSSMCRSMSAGRSPRISPDTGALPALADQHAAAAAARVEVGAYIGTPITSPDGTLFGTVCGYNPEALPDVPDGLESLLDLLSTLLSAVLEADVATTTRRRELERVVGEAETDALTGLLNRRGWERWTTREEARFRRFGDPASVVVVDLDLLKVVNDSHGHDAGDDYLRRAAEVLRRTVGDTGALARLGGDEFALVVRDDPAETLPVADRVQAALDAAGVLGSVGAAPYGVVAGFDGACEAADRAMYADKLARRAARAGQPAPR